MFGRERNGVVSRAILKTAERDSANAIYKVFYAALWCIVKSSKEKNEKVVDIFVGLRQFFDEGHKIVLQMHPTRPERLMSMVTSLTIFIEVEDFELQTFLELVEEAARLRKKVMKVRSKALDNAASWQSLQMLYVNFTAGLDQVVDL